MAPQTVQSKQGTYSYDDSDWGLDEETLKELDLNWTLDGIKPLQPVTKMVEEKVTERRMADDSKPKGPRYSSRVMDIIQRGQAMPLANSQARKSSDLRSVLGNFSKGANLDNPLGILGALVNPQQAAIRGGLNAGKGILSGIANNYQGMHTGGDVPALSRGVQLGSAYDVYGDRSDRNTWAVSNNGKAVVSRDADTGWTSVTSNVNGKGPVTTIDVGDGMSAAHKIVCTAMNEDYGFGSYRNAIWLKYAQDNLTDYHEKGYHKIFRPLLKLGRESQPWLYSTLKHIARHRSVDLRAEMKGSKRDTLGRIYRAILEPTCYLVGRMIGDNK
jgi:hypothetical protein